VRHQGRRLIVHPHVKRDAPTEVSRTIATRPVCDRAICPPRLGATATRAPAAEPSCSARRWLVPALGVSGNCYIVRTYFDHRGMLSINPWRGRAGCGNDVGQATPPAPSSRDLHHSAYPARLSQR
jgi:hypothetical protein